MKNLKKIDNFKVEVFESVRAGRVWFTVRLHDYPSAMAEGAVLSDALEQLSQKWDEIKIAYINSGLKPPEPRRIRRNENIKRTLSRLASRPPYSPEFL
jgi:hypothetical protein